MLSWPTGARSEDGIRARHWYHALHQSSCSAPYVAKGDFPSHLAALLAECRPWYAKLFEHAIRASRAN